jgi:anthranilate synthase component 1
LGGTTSLSSLETIGSFYLLKNEKGAEFMFYPTLEQAKELSKGYDVIPVAFEMLADTHTPINLFLSFKDSSENCFLLESAENGEQWGRYSFIGFNPAKEIIIKDNKVTIIDENGTTNKITDNPLAIISEIMNQYKSPKIKDMPKLTGGLVGYFAYDTVRYIEKRLKNAPNNDLDLPDCHFMLCDEIIAFDHLKHRTIITVNIPTKGDFEKNYQIGSEKAVEIAKKIRIAPPVPEKSKPSGELVIKSNLSKEQFTANVEKAKQYIKDGDIFQVVLSQRFEAENPPDSFDVYRVLRATNPSPYMYYFKFKDYYIAGASPEMLVSVEARTVFTRPIAGTMKRGRDEKEDNMLENRLISDKKEQAEHTMLVDLGRNDVGKVAKFGTVEVTKFMSVEKYSQVMHLVSDIKATLKDDKTNLDALLAVLPAGTLSGAPKVRAMEIIDEMELQKRGLYGGTAGYIGFNGDMDTCIAIRTILFRNNKAYVQAGAGIVADSIAESEYEETENKAKAMLKAIKEAREFL